MFNQNLTRSKKLALNILATLFILTTLVDQLAGANGQAWATGPGLADVNVSALIALVEDNQGQQAVEQIAELAYALGNFAAAPGDAIAYDPYMQRAFRGAVVDYDELPEACTSRTAFDPEACAAAFWAMENKVRFGPSFFTTRQEDGSELPRSGDDMLATYIEETGHSWQEYQYETYGQGGDRARGTTLEDAHHWAPGREYQVKRYILSLDGDLIELSDMQRSSLKNAICISDYASPIGNEVPSYGPPAGWPNPDGWPTSNPTLDELVSFCGVDSYEPEI